LVPMLLNSTSPGWAAAGSATADPGTGVRLIRPGFFGGRYVCELLVSLPDSSAL
jgi:hypothetical protein